MTHDPFAEAFRAAVATEVGPLVAEVRRLIAEVSELRRSLPAALRTVEEAAEALGVSESTVRRGIRDGSIPVRRIGRSVRVDLGALRPLSSDDVAAEARAARCSP